MEGLNLWKAAGFLESRSNPDIENLENEFRDHVDRLDAINVGQESFPGRDCICRNGVIVDTENLCDEDGHKRDCAKVCF